ncbi:MAG: hypothetical protein HDR21_04655 [Lachnospiraceae bacterium]|nr:hypothetical protein [Lachnospiraceae bacterium]
MSKRVFVSADWKEPFDSHSWDKEVVDRIRKWKDDSRYGVDLICTDDVHNSVTSNKDCRRCDIKEECGRYIKSSSVVIFVVGDNTASKKAGACDGIACSPAYSGLQKKVCNSYLLNRNSNWKGMSYLEYEITTAVLEEKDIILVFNSAYKKDSWVPTWYQSLLNKYYVNELCRVAFWEDSNHTKDCYQDIKIYLQ